MIATIYSLDIYERRNFIKSYLKKMEISYKTQIFSSDDYNGENIIIKKWAKKNMPNIIISTHYDGWGAYDNAGGTAGLLWLIKWIQKDKLDYIDGTLGIIIVFLDGEEKGLLGVKNYVPNFLLKEGLHVQGQISLDGFGIGTHIGGFANTRKIKLRVDSEKEIELLLEADTSIFQQYNIPSLHLFSLPYEELEALLNENTFPHTWRILHTKEDMPDKIDEECMPFVIFNLYRAIPFFNFQSRGIIQVGENT